MIGGPVAAASLGRTETNRADATRGLACYEEQVACYTLDPVRSFVLTTDYLTLTEVIPGCPCSPRCRITRRESGLLTRDTFNVEQKVTVLSRHLS